MRGATGPTVDLCLMSGRIGLRRQGVLTGVLRTIVMGLLASTMAAAQGSNPDASAVETSQPESASAAVRGAPERSWLREFVRDNFTFRTELYSQFTFGREIQADPPVYSRQSAGFEVLKKFSTATATVAAFNAQFRLVRRDNYTPVQNDLEGSAREGFFPEYHNVYLDLYNALNPLMSESARGRNIGRFNLRLGRFYLPFGINLQTDTHATLLQLSNEQNFGFERDWHAGFYGSLTRDVSYDAYYMAASGYYPRFHGQMGLVGARFSLGSRFFNEYGIQGGISFIGGERISEHAVMRSPSVAAKSPRSNIVRTLRFGLDGRYTRPLWNGTVTVTTELSGGRDESDGIFTNLHQFDYLSRNRRWGWAAQYRRFWQDIVAVAAVDTPSASGKADSALAGEFTLYFRNDISSSRLHRLKFNVERRLESMTGERPWLFTVQYYWYW